MLNVAVEEVVFGTEQAQIFALFWTVMLEQMVLGMKRVWSILIFTILYSQVML